MAYLEIRILLHDKKNDICNKLINLKDLLSKISHIQSINKKSIYVEVQFILSGL